MRANFLIKVSSCVAICFLNVGFIKKNLPHCLIYDELFFYLSNVDAYYVSYAAMYEYLNFFRRDVRSAHLSHTHRSKLIGAEIKTGHLMQILMLAYVQNLVRALIDEFNAARYTSML